MNDQGKTERSVGGKPDHDMLQPKETYLHPWPKRAQKKARRAYGRTIPSIRGHFRPLGRPSFSAQFIFRTKNNP